MQIALLYAAVAGMMPDYAASPAAQKAAALVNKATSAAPAAAPLGSVAAPRSAPTAITRETESLSSSQATDGSQSGDGGGGSAEEPKPALRSASGQSSGPAVPNPAASADRRTGAPSA